MPGAAVVARAELDALWRGKRAPDGGGDVQRSELATPIVLPLGTDGHVARGGKLGPESGIGR